MYGGNNRQHQDVLFCGYSHFSGFRRMLRFLLLLPTGIVLDVGSRWPVDSLFLLTYFLQRSVITCLCDCWLLVARWDHRQWSMFVQF